MSKHLRFPSLLTAVLIFALNGCAGFAIQGSFDADRDVERSFARYEFRRDMNYYSSGSDSHPNALLGLSKEYTLESGLWKKVESAATFKEMVQGMQKKTGELMLTLHGFRIRDDAGKEIGIWYSILEARAGVVMKGEKRILIYTPAIDTYLRYEEDDRKGWRLF
jgi:hypothetical protein